MKSVIIKRETTWLDPQIPAGLLFNKDSRAIKNSSQRSERPTARWNRAELMSGPVSVQ